MKNTRHCTICGASCKELAPFVFECANKHRNYLNPVPGSTVFVVNKNKQVLYARRAIEPHKGGLNIVGEIMLPGETAEKCAIRGCKEEFDIDVEILDYLGSYAGDYGSRKTLNLVFVAEHTSGDIRAGDDLEPDSHHWRNMDELPAAQDLAWAWVAEPQEILKKWLRSWHVVASRSV